MTPGTIILHPNFRFHDGGVSNKILISLGQHNDITVLAKTTSKGYRYDTAFGCQCEARFPCFHLVQNCCTLPKPTWVCLNEFYEFTGSELLLKRSAGEYRHMGDLSPDLTRLLIECVLSSDDISGRQENIVRAANGL